MDMNMMCVKLENKRVKKNFSTILYGWTNIEAQTSTT